MVLMRISYSHAVIGKSVQYSIHEWSTGEPTGPLTPVLWLHGLGPQSGLNAADFAEGLCALGNYRVVAPDFPGYGGSEALPSDTYSAPSMARAIIDNVVDAAQAPLQVIGHSWGAEVALFMVADRKNLVRSLVLLDGGYEDWPPVPADEAMRDAIAFAGQCRFDSVESALDDVRADLHNWSPNIEKAYRSALVERDGAITIRQRPETYAAIRMGGGAYPVSQTWRHLGDVPVLLAVPVTGREHLPGPARTDPMAQNVKQLTITRLENCGHLVPDDAGSRLSPVIHEWWQTLADQPRSSVTVTGRAV